MTEAAEAKKGDRVKIHYRESTDENIVFDSTMGMPPFEFTIGAGEAMPALDNGVCGMKEGEMKTVVAPPEEAYGTRDEGLVGLVPKNLLDPGVEPKPGLVIQVNQPDGGKKNLSIKEIDDVNVKVDGNHPLAGKEITLRIRLVEIVE